MESEPPRTALERFLYGLAQCDFQKYFNIIAAVQMLGLIYAIVRINSGMEDVSPGIGGPGGSRRPGGNHTQGPGVMAGPGVTVAVGGTVVQGRVSGMSDARVLSRCEWPGENPGPVYAGRPTVSYPWVSSPRLPRATTRGEYEQLLGLLGALSLLLDQANVTYLMADGTLLGSYVMHDVIPWDDDADVMIKFDDVPKVAELFRDPKLRRKLSVDVTSYHDVMDFYSLESLRTPFDTSIPLLDEWRYIKRVVSTGDYDPKRLQNRLKFKFYSRAMKRGTHQISGYTWRWPYVDVKYYLENASHVWNVDVPSETYYWTRGEMYPLYRRPLGPLRLPAPRDSGAVLRTKYRDFSCLSSPYNHQHEHFETGRRRQNCSRLAEAYPFVRREILASALVERKQIGTRIYGYFCMPVTNSARFSSISNWLL